MTLRLVCFTGAGAELGRRIVGFLEKQGHVCSLYTSARQAEKTGLLSFGGSLSDWMAGCFDKEIAQGFIFIGACGIAVRAIAPCLRGKTVDPAVVAVDEAGRFSISLLSGHIGQANRLAAGVAEAVGAMPVVTTATDVREVFSVDSWAVQHGCTLSDMGLAKEVSAALLAGEPVGIASAFPFAAGNLPAGLLQNPDCPLGICIDIRNVSPFARTLLLFPRIVHLGIGCRRGTSHACIRQAVEHFLNRHSIAPQALAGIASITVKKNEDGLLAFAQGLGLPIRFFPPEELRQAKGSFASSPFVERTVGVDNVCERAAVLSSRQGILLAEKYAEAGVTVAAAREDWSVDFEYQNDWRGL